jgi:hypothetical protein
MQAHKLPAGGMVIFPKGKHIRTRDHKFLGCCGQVSNATTLKTSVTCDFAQVYITELTKNILEAYYPGSRVSSAPVSANPVYPEAQALLNATMPSPAPTEAAPSRN